MAFMQSEYNNLWVVVLILIAVYRSRIQMERQRALLNAPKLKRDTVIIVL